MKTPSEYFNKPVIGKITTRPLVLSTTSQDGIISKETLPPETYEVIEEVLLGDS